MSQLQGRFYEIAAPLSEQRAAECYGALYARQQCRFLSSGGGEKTGRDVMNDIFSVHQNMHIFASFSGTLDNATPVAVGYVVFDIATRQLDTRLYVRPQFESERGSLEKAFASEVERLENSLPRKRVLAIA